MDVAGVYQALQKNADTDIDKARRQAHADFADLPMTAVPAYLEQPPKADQLSDAAPGRDAQYARR